MGILAMILAGGKGERLHPLTIHRAKPAVPFGGIYRIIDFTLSNCINAGIRKIAVLPQYKSLSLDKHLRLAWNLFSGELNEYIISVPPQQRVGDKWYQGTADAVRKQLMEIRSTGASFVLILAGDQGRQALRQLEVVVAQELERGERRTEVRATGYDGFGITWSASASGNGDHADGAGDFDVVAGDMLDLASKLGA